jgi:hypothetical protein
MGIQLANNCTTTLSAGLVAASTTMFVASTSAMPTLGGSDYTYATLVSQSGGTDQYGNPAVFEVVKILGPLTPGATTTLTVTRAVDNTVATQFVAGDVCDLRVNAQTLRDLSGVTGTVTAVTASAPLTSSGGSAPNIALTTPLSLAQGGTGGTTQATAITALLPAQTGLAGNLLTTNGTNASWEAVVPIVNGGTGATSAFNALAALGAAPNSPSFLTLATNAQLTSERVFTPGSNITATDGGAGSTYTVNLSATPSVTSVTMVTMAFNAVYPNGSITGATTINLNNGQFQSATMVGNVTLTLTAPTLGPGMYQIDFTQDGTGSRILTLPATVKFPGGYTAVQKALSTTPNALDTLVLRWNGSYYVANLGQAEA